MMAPAEVNIINTFVSCISTRFQASAQEIVTLLTQEHVKPPLTMEINLGRESKPWMSIQLTDTANWMLTLVSMEEKWYMNEILIICQSP